MERKTYDAGEAAELLGLSRSMVYKACREGEIPALRFGTRWVIPRQGLDALLDGCRQNRRQGPSRGRATETFDEMLQRKLGRRGA